MASSQVCAQTDARSNPPAPPRRSETFLHKVLRISGIAASPAALKGPGDDVRSGQIWLVDASSKKTTKVSNEQGYRSPVFALKETYIFALRGSDVVRFSVAGGAAQKMFAIDGIQKLVGADEDDPGRILILAADASGKTAVGLLSMSTGKVEAVAYDGSSTEDRQMLEHLRSWDRIYGDKRVYVKRQSKDSLSGRVQWTDVFLKEGPREEVNVSQCDETNCGQPSLSPDGKFVVFVKAAD